jgi:hypothetical protein
MLESRKLRYLQVKLAKCSLGSGRPKAPSNEIGHSLVVVLKLQDAPSFSAFTIAIGKSLGS